MPRRPSLPPVIEAAARFLRRGPARSLLRTVQLIIAVLLALLLVSVGTTLGVRLTVAAAQKQLNQHVLPARDAASALHTAYLDQETGLHGYLLSGSEQALRLYTQGRSDVQRLSARLSVLLAGDPQGPALLREVQAAGHAWETGTAEPGIAARRAGPVPEAELARTALTGQASFDELSNRLGALEQRTVELTGAQIDRISSAQRLANVVTLVALALALVVAIGALPLLHHLITVPLHRLIGQVQAVAGGSYGERIDVGEPEELATIARSVDRMRDAVVEHSQHAVTAERELVLREEHDRLATDLHDLTIQRIFGLGLALTSLARRNPELAGGLKPLIEETDAIVREVRTVIFDLGRTEGTESLRGHVIDLAEESARALGFSPALEFAGPVDTLADEELGNAVLAVLREALSNVARHARATRTDIRLSTEDGLLRLCVTDDGVGIDDDVVPGYGLGNMTSRAARLGGTVAVRPRTDGPGTVVEWQVPVRHG